MESSVEEGHLSAEGAREARFGTPLFKGRTDAIALQLCKQRISDKQDKQDQSP